MALEDRTHRGHAVLDLASRERKATKIAMLLGAVPGGPIRRLLEVGTGSGGIAHYFGEAGPLAWAVDSVDIQDVRLVRDGYQFTAVKDAMLPFPDASFDVVLSNHVIEHVGDPRQQTMHLAELARVLRADGIGYLAVPCRWMVMEPHYKLPFLSWLPQLLADAYVRSAGKGTHYDCRPLTVKKLEAMLAKAGFNFEQHHGNALRLTFELENPKSPVYRWLLKPIPDSWYAAFRSLFPTLIYTLQQSGTEIGGVPVMSSSLFAGRRQ